MLTVALLAGLSAASPAADSDLRDPFAPRAVTSEVAPSTSESSSELVDPFSRPRSASPGRTSTQLSDPFAAREPDFGQTDRLRDPFASPPPAPRLAAVQSAEPELADPFATRVVRASSSAASDLRDPFAR